MKILLSNEIIINDENDLINFLFVVGVQLGDFCLLTLLTSYNNKRWEDNHASYGSWYLILKKNHANGK